MIPNLARASVSPPSRNYSCIELLSSQIPTETDFFFLLLFPSSLERHEPFPPTPPQKVVRFLRFVPLFCLRTLFPRYIISAPISRFAPLLLFLISSQETRVPLISGLMGASGEVVLTSLPYRKIFPEGSFVAAPFERPLPRPGVT